MKMKIISILTILVFATVTMGCASVAQETEQHPGAATGAGIGAVGGAVAGSALGGRGARTETAIIGGLLGALVGGLVGHYTYDVKRSRAETDRHYGYNPSEGVTMRFEDAWVEPKIVSPGQEVEMASSYAILTPQPGQEVTVRETREIKFGNELVGRPEVTVSRGGGTYTSKVPLTLPPDAKPGAYKVYTTIEIPNAKDTREAIFHVQ
jgi:hypothetical protein